MVLQLPDLPPSAISWPEPRPPHPPGGGSPAGKPDVTPGATGPYGTPLRERPSAYPTREAASTAPTAARLSAGLCRLLNAVVIYPELRDVFLESPAEAASLATRDQGMALGDQLPDPLLRLPPIALEEGDWALLRRLEPSRTLAEASRKLTALAGSAAAPDE